LRRATNLQPSAADLQSAAFPDHRQNVGGTLFGDSPSSLITDSAIGDCLSASPTPPLRRATNLQPSAADLQSAAFPEHRQNVGGTLFGDSPSSLITDSAIGDCLSASPTPPLRRATNLQPSAAGLQSAEFPEHLQNVDATLFGDFPPGLATNVSQLKSLAGETGSVACPARTAVPI
jgi:hypothetical protein